MMSLPLKNIGFDVLFELFSSSLGSYLYLFFG